MIAGLTLALGEIPELAKSAAGDGATDNELGVVVFVVHPEPAFYRLGPESVARLRAGIAQRLRERLRDGDRLYGIGEWEWLVVLPKLRSSATLSMAMMRFRQVFESSGLDVDGMTLQFSVSCGAAIYPSDGEDAVHLVQSARIAALNAARHGLGEALYEPSMEELDYSLREFDHELRKVLTEGAGLELHLQPQIQAQSGRCVGAEALLRWRRAKGESVAPPVVLAGIERIGMRHRFNRWLFLTAARISSQLNEAGVEIQISINISANDLLDQEMPDLVDQSLKTWGVSPAAIQIEITETSMVQETQTVGVVLKRLRSLGIVLSVDDFGTGYSSISHLKNLPVQEVKIDQSFVRNILNSKHDQEITGSTIRLAHRLGLKVVAEGVETGQIAGLLAEMGCDLLQGYLFARAMEVSAFVAWYQARRVAHGAA